MAVSSAAEEDADFVFDTVGAVCVDAQGACLDFARDFFYTHCAAWLHEWQATYHGVEALAASTDSPPLGMQAGWRRGCPLEGLP